MARPLRIVIVEDDPTFRQVLQALFSEHWEVHALADGETAVPRIKELQPHLVIVDFRLPGIDGIELAQALREDPDTRSIPVVMLSGVAGPLERDRALDTGILDVLVKPVSERDLRRRAESIAAIAADHRAALEAVQKRQQDAEDRLRLLLENVRDYAIVMLDADGHVVGWSGALQGWTESELQGRHLSSLYPEAERGRVSALLGAAAVTRSAHDAGWQLRGDGTLFWADSVATALYASGGGLRGFAIITRDLTGQRLAERERERLLQEARAANDAKERFLATLSHELRTPLNAILGWVHLLRGGQLDAAKTARAVEVIERNAQSQARLVEDVLDLSRILAGRVTLESEPTDVAGAVAAALESTQSAAAARQVAVETDLAETPLVLGDARRLQQVVASVLANAVKYSPAGGQIALRTTAGDGRVRIVVEDHGPGIPADFLPRLFVPFEQADASPTRQHGGMGLGLSISKLLVERHGGTIGVASTAAGTTVTIDLPAMGGAAAAAAEETASARSHDLAGLRVLVVDDHRDTAEFVSLMLRGLGAVVTMAGGADEALALVAGRPDVILADVEMPGRSGLDLVRALRAMPPEAGGATPAIAFTAYARAEDRDGALAAGFDAHVAKPVNPGELMEAVQRLGRRGRALAPEAAAAHLGVADPPGAALSESPGQDPSC